MRYHLFSSLLFLSATLFFSCQEKEKPTLPIVAPKEIITVHTQKFSELVKDIRIVLLETNNDCLLGRNVTYWARNNYILAIAPRLMDEPKERFYFLDFQNNSSIRFVDLKSGDNTGKIPAQSRPTHSAITDYAIIYYPEVRIEPTYYKKINIENNTLYEAKRSILHFREREYCLHNSC